MPRSDSDVFFLNLLGFSYQNEHQFELLESVRKLQQLPILNKCSKPQTFGEKRISEMRIMAISIKKDCNEENENAELIVCIQLIRHFHFIYACVKASVTLPL